MPNTPIAVFLSASPSLNYLNRPLLNQLSAQMTIGLWEYQQSLDEANSLQTAIALLHKYLVDQPPVHLIGHGTSGLLGLLYARCYPNQVRSLTLMAVGNYPARDWHSHYYHNLDFLPCSRQMVLTQMVYSLFGFQPQPETRRLSKLLEQDLYRSLSPHNAFQHFKLCPDHSPVPLLVTGSQDDVIISPHEIYGWQNWLSDQDRIWICPSGRHFFQYHHPQWISQRIFDFWSSLEQSALCRSTLENLYIASSW